MSGPPHDPWTGRSRPPRPPRARPPRGLAVLEARRPRLAVLALGLLPLLEGLTQAVLAPAHLGPEEVADGLSIQVRALGARLVLAFGLDLLVDLLDELGGHGKREPACGRRDWKVRLVSTHPGLEHPKHDLVGVHLRLAVFLQKGHQVLDRLDQIAGHGASLAGGEVPDVAQPVLGLGGVLGGRVVVVCHGCGSPESKERRTDSERRRGGRVSRARGARWPRETSSASELRARGAQEPSEASKASWLGSSPSSTGWRSRNSIMAL